MFVLFFINFCISFFSNIILIPLIDEFRVKYFLIQNNLLVVFDNRRLLIFGVTFLLTSLLTFIGYMVPSVREKVKGRIGNNTIIILTLVITTIVSGLICFITFNEYYTINLSGVYHHGLTSNETESFDELTNIQVKGILTGQYASTLTISYFLNFRDGTSINVMESYPSQFAYWGQPKIESKTIDSILQLEKILSQVNHNYIVSNEAIKQIDLIYNPPTSDELKKILNLK